ncbi:hypothetical protein ABKN59_006985 [Abortiporus biennis]
MDHDFNIVPGFPDDVERTAGLPRLDLPPELWLHICESFDLEKSHFRNLSLCNSTLRLVAQPFAFKKVELSSYFIHSSRRSSFVYAQTPSYLASLLERFEFLCSPRIAHAIRSISFQSRVSDAILRSELTIDCQIIADTLFRHITAFHNLTSISAEGFRFTTDHLLQTFQLPKLEIFRLTECSAEITQRINITYPCPKLRELSLCNAYCDGEGSIHPWWMYFIGQDTTERLSLFPLDHYPSTCILKSISSSPPLLCLKSLTLGSKRLEAFDIIEVLSKCPSLEEFNVGSQGYYGERHTQELENILSKDIVSHLVCISGPLYFILPFLRDRTIQTFRCRSEDMFDFNDNSFVLDRLRDNAPHLRSLSLSFLRHNLIQYFSILSHFREMQSFRVICFEHICTVKEVCESLYHADIPITLQSLELTTYCRPTYKIYPPSPQVEERFNQEFPNLSSVWITAPEFQFKWNRII